MSGWERPVDCYKCLKVSGTRPGYCHRESASRGDLIVVQFLDRPEERHEFTRAEFRRQFVMRPPMGNAKIREIWNSFPGITGEQL